jgi:L-alanine-DL-glutamate epimerase-like enolase superfamily enzyme
MSTVNISPKDVMKLRDRTGLGMGDCKNALVEANGDMEAAEKLIREKMKGKMDARTDRAAGEGCVAVAMGNGKVAIVEIRSETDFTARNEEFRAMAADVAYNSMDLLQAAHTWSGIEMALWDLLGKAQGEPAWRLLGYDRAFPKVPYASVLFGATPEETLARARAIRADGFRAAKFGWAPFGASLSGDIDQLDAAREGLGPDGILLIDAGQIFGEDVEAAAARLPAMERNRVTWFEEPFAGEALEAYGALARRSGAVAIAGGEAAHNRFMARHLIDIGGVGYIQIDCGRIGGLAPAHEVALHAAAKGVTYVNHTFTSNLALSASLQPYAGLEAHRICEYPTGLQPLARDLTVERILPDGEGLIQVPDAPGLGIEVSAAALETYRVPVEIRVRGKTVFSA